MIPNTMWPMLLDMSRDECKRILRRLELEAYSSIVSALRAQGALSVEKRKLLNDLSSILNISVERHRAEVRRAVNDEKLSTIAEHMSGPNTSTEWAIEGRRLVPLMPRLVPQTALTALANKMADITATENAKLPPPAQTFKLKAEDSTIPEISRHDNINNSKQFGSPLIPPVLSVKRVEKEDDRCGKRRCRSSSTERIVSSGAQPISPPLLQTKTSFISGSHISPQIHQQQYVQHNQLNPQVQPPQSQTLSAVTPSQMPPQQHSVNNPTNQSIPTEFLQPHLQGSQSQTAQILQQTPPAQPSQLCASEQGTRELVPQVSQQNRLPDNSHATQISAVKIQEVIVSSQSPSTQVQSSQTSSHTRVVSGGSGNTPVKITFTSSTSRSAICNIGTSTTTTITTTTPAPTTQKVIIVQSSAAAVGGGPPSILQRSLTVPVVKSSPAAAAVAAAAAGVGNSTSTAPRASLIISGPSGSPPVTPTTIVTISTNPVNNSNVTATTVSIGGVPTAAYITSPANIPHIRPKAVQLPSRLRPRPGSIVIPVTPNSLGSSTNLPGVTLKTTPIQSSRTGVHMKTECSGMKIVPITPGSGGTTKILPKPSFGGGSSQPPVYMMSSTTSSITMVTRTVSTSCPSSRMVTVNATTLPSSVQGTTLQGRPVTTLVTKAGTGGSTGRTQSGKPNVIVVQKGSGGSFPRGVTVSGGRVQGFSATLQDVLSKVVGNKTLSVVGSSGGNTTSPVVTTMSMQKAQQQGLNLPPGTQAGNVVVLDLSHENVSKNMVLADILQASGITSDGDVDSVVVDKESLPQVSETNETLQMSENSATDRSMTGDCPEVAGELDPQTGIYSLTSEQSPEDGSEGSSGTSVPNSSSGNIDIFSTALASADINLESFQFVEEGLGSLSNSAQPSSNIEVTVAEENIPTQDPQEQLNFLHDLDTNVPITDATCAMVVDQSHVA